MNNDLLRKRSKSVAEGLLAHSLTPEERIKQLWLRVFNRPSTDTEQVAVLTFLSDLDSIMTGARDNARESLKWQELCHSLLSSNEFIYRL